MPPEIAHCAMCSLPLFDGEGSLALRWSDTRPGAPFGLGRVEVCSWTCAARWADLRVRLLLAQEAQP